MQPDANASSDTKLNRLRLRLGRFSTGKNKAGGGGAAGGAGSAAGGGNTALGLVEGNSTNTVNTVEDTEFSSSNVDSKSRAGIEVSASSIMGDSFFFMFEIGFGTWRQPCCGCWEWACVCVCVRIQSKFHNA